MIRIKVKESSSVQVKVDAFNKVVVKVKELQPIKIEAFNYPPAIDLLNKRIDELELTGGKQIELQKSATHIQWRYIGDDEWIDLVALSELKGEDGTTPQKGVDYFDGQNVELQKSATHIQWRYIGDDEWIDLVALSELKGEKGDPQTREELGLGVANSPEFTDVLITNLQSDEAAGGGAIPDAEWVWLGAGAKTILSVFTNIIHYLYSIKDVILFATPRLNQTLTGAILLDRCITQYNNLTLTGALEISVGANSLVEGSAEGVIIGNGTNTPTLNGITLWATSASFDPTNLKQNHFMVWKQGDGVYIAWTQKN